MVQTEMAATTNRRAQHGALTAAIWLIGLGIIFLVQQYFAIPWEDAWPLFLILAGIATGARWFLGWGAPYARPAIPALLPSLILTVVGVILLLVNLDIWRLDLATLWPILLIAIGVAFLIGAVWPGSSPAPDDRLAVELAGLPEAKVAIRFGAGELRVAAGEPGRLVEGEFRGGVVMQRPAPDRVELHPDTRGMWPWGGERLDWRIGLSPDPVLELNVEGGASRSELDLRELRVRRLDLRTGASQTTVWLPANAGVTAVSADAGAAQLAFRVAPGVAARIRSQMVLGSTQVDTTRFPAQGSGRWESADYAAAANRVEIEVRGGVGSVSIG
jgi:hypothetical protein